MNKKLKCFQITINNNGVTTIFVECDKDGKPLPKGERIVHQDPGATTSKYERLSDYTFTFTKSK